MSKSILIVVLSLITIAGFYFYLSNKLPPGVEPKGNETIVALISLFTAIISLLGTVLTFILKIIEIKANKERNNFLFKQKILIKNDSIFSIGTN